MFAQVGADESSKSAMYVLAPLLRPLITLHDGINELDKIRGDERDEKGHG